MEYIISFTCGVIVAYLCFSLLGSSHTAEELPVARYEKEATNTKLEPREEVYTNSTMPQQELDLQFDLSGVSASDNFDKIDVESREDDIQSSLDALKSLKRG